MKKTKAVKTKVVKPKLPQKNAAANLSASYDEKRKAATASPELIKTLNPVQLSAVKTKNKDGNMENNSSNAMDLSNVRFERADGKQENGPLKIIKAKELEEAGTLGAIVQGTYLRTTISEKYKTPSYIFSTSDGDVLINGCGSLNKQMANVNEGDLVQVEYRGSAIIKDGQWKGTKSHLFTVLKAVDVADAE